MEYPSSKDVILALNQQVHLHTHSPRMYPLPPSFPRLRLSPSPPPTKVTVSRTSGSGHSQTTRVHHSSSAAAASSSHNSSGMSVSKKRRLNDNDSETSSVTGNTVTKTRISQQASASGRITVDEVDMEGRYIRLSNKADEVAEIVHYYTSTPK